MAILSSASFEQQQTYWWIVCVLMWSAFAVTCFAIYEWRVKKHEAYQKDMVKGFIPMFLGNIVWMITYLPFHTFNAFSSAVNEEDFNLEEYPTWVCKASMTGLIAFMMFSWWGMVIVAYSLHTTIKAALAARQNHEPISTRCMVFSLVFPLVLTIGYYFLDYDNIGPYRGLYCLWEEWNATNFSWGIVVWGLCAVLMVYFYADSYRLLKTLDSNASKTAIRNMAMHSVKFVGIFLVCGSPVLIEIIWALVDEPPVELTMFGGIMLKVKCILDAVVILTLPAVSKERSRKKEERKMTLKTLTANSDSGPGTAGTVETDKKYVESKTSDI